MELILKFNEKEENFEIRKKVFIEEQGFINEYDAIDEYAEFITLYVDGILAGCARCYFENHTHKAIFGRLAILSEFRGKGLGKYIVTMSEKHMKELGATSIHLHAQYYVRSLYESLGYITYGKIDFDEQVEHIWMKKEL